MTQEFFVTIINDDRAILFTRADIEKALALMAVFLSAKEARIEVEEIPSAKIGTVVW